MLHGTHYISVTTLRTFSARSAA